MPRVYSLGVGPGEKGAVFFVEAGHSSPYAVSGCISWTTYSSCMDVPVDDTGQSGNRKSLRGSAVTTDTAEPVDEMMPLPDEGGPRTSMPKGVCALCCGCL